MLIFGVYFFIIWAVCKCIQGVLTGAVAAVYYAFFFKPSATAATCLPLSDVPKTLILGEVTMLVLFCLVPVFAEIKSKRKAS